MIHIDRIHIVTEQALSEIRARELGATFAGELNSALQIVRVPAPHVRIGELTVRINSSALGDRRLLSQFAYSVARRIHDRKQD